MTTLLLHCSNQTRQREITTKKKRIPHKHDVHCKRTWCYIILYHQINALTMNVAERNQQTIHITRRTLEYQNSNQIANKNDINVMRHKSSIVVVVPFHFFLRLSFVSNTKIKYLLNRNSANRNYMLFGLSIGNREMKRK